MSSSEDTHRQSAEQARALLAGLDIQPSPDFAVQVLARVYALQAGRVPQPAPYARPLPSQRPSRGWRTMCWHVRRRPQVPRQKIVAGGLVMAGVVLLWCVSMTPRPPALPERARHASTALPYDMAPRGDHLDDSGRRAAALPEVVNAAELALQPSTLASQSRETQRDEGNLTRGGAHVACPEAHLTPGLPVWLREAPKLSVQAQEQQSGRQRGVRGKAKRSGKSLRPTRHVPA